LGRKGQSVIAAPSDGADEGRESDFNNLVRFGDLDKEASMELARALNNALGMTGKAALVAAAAVALAASAGQAQTAGGGGETVVRTSGNPSKDTLNRMMRPVTIDLNEQRLEDVMKYVVEVTGANLEVFWRPDFDDGMDKDKQVSLSVKGVSALTFLEKVFEKLEGGLGEHTWQMGENGQLQVGPKKRLNKYKRVEVYDINDLLFLLPIYDNAPQIDLNQVLQQSGGKGGGGGQSPFKQNGEQNRQEQQGRTKEDRGKEIIDIIQNTVENDPQQWIDLGGEGGTIRYYQGNLIVNAPDYLHRQVNGYKWWPAFRAGGSSSGGQRRYVSLNGDTSINKVDVPIRTFPIPGVAGGGGQGGGTPPGGG
jgi:hypothetical protein